MKVLLEGLERFRNEVYPRHRELYATLRDAQRPEVLFISCSDSRVVPNFQFQTLPGELFICRNVGNIVPPWGEHTGGVSAAIEYAVRVCNVKHIVVCGHTDCGAMKAALHPESVASMPAVSHWLKNTERVLAVVRELHGQDDAQTLGRLIEENALAQLDHLATHPSVAARMRAGALRLHAWVFDIANAEFTAYDPKQGRFVPLADVAADLLRED